MEIKKVNPKPINKTFFLPSSKSYLNRLLILAALDTNKNQIFNYSPSQDVIDLINALKRIGVEIEVKNDSLVISNSFPRCEKLGEQVISLELGEGGTTSRFLMALLCLGKNSYRLNVCGKLNERPFEDLLLILKQLGASIESVGEKLFPLILRGPIQIPKQLDVSTQHTTQFVSALMLAFSGHEVNFNFEKNQSVSYIELTKHLIQLAKEGTYKSAPDFSSLAFPACLAMMGGEIRVPNLHQIDLFQADSLLLGLLKQLGAHINWEREGFYLKGVESFSGFEIDAKDCLDLIPALSFLASYACSPSKFRNLKFLSHKESDRLREIIFLLEEFNVIHNYDSLEDELIIQGNGPKCGFKKIATAPDHRMVMTAYLFLRHNHGGELSHFECVKKSFPSFFECME
jgi:3-phosphoshikimate 1-carboxyvinyltransferase